MAILEHLYKRTTHLHANCLYNALVFILCEQGVSAPNSTHYFLYVLCASNLRCFQAMYLKFAENVDILVQIVNAKLYNEREKNNGYNGCKKM